MSQDRLSIVGLDPGGAKAHELAAGALEWLLASGVIAANAARDLHPLISEWGPGPAWRTLVSDDVLNDPRSQRWFEVFETATLPGVDVVAERAFYHPVEADQPPLCGQCGAGLPWDIYYSYHTPWGEGGPEPRLSCPACGWEALAGDWLGESSWMVGAPAVTFIDWPELKGEFIEALRPRLGRRSAVVRAHL
jgi:hypothetical protein